MHWTYDIAGATVKDNTLWGGKCVLFDNGPRLRVDDDPAIENADRITIEAWVNALSWPTRAVVCRKDGSYILYNYRGDFFCTSMASRTGCSTTSRARLGTAPGATSSAPTTRTPGRTTSVFV